MVQRGVVKLQYVAMEEQIANVLMKPLARVKFMYFRERLGVLQTEAFSQKMASALISNQVGHIPQSHQNGHALTSDHVRQHPTVISEWTSVPD